MSGPAADDLGELRHSKNEQPSNQPHVQESTQHIAQVSDADPSVKSVPTDPLSQLRALVATMKKPADRSYFQVLCKDGILRNLCFLPTPPDQPTEIAVYDGKPLSPELLKAYLGRRVR
ncbi:hypothetical protein GQ44DRAFT_819371 [Phaeosphaeriaceae sp. PMI808]|nr:hypothetical protein GQ44DRAFT_819371 [Phaeosphaeriaceae sp. PMI808]